MGISTWGTVIEVESAKLNGKPLDFSNWQASGGDYKLADGIYRQNDVRAEGRLSVAPEKATGEKIVYEVRARKIRGREGFLVVFGYQGDDHYYWWNVGGWGNSEHAIQQPAAAARDLVTWWLAGLPR